MVHIKGNRPELPIEAYQFAEMHHLGSPLKMYRANVTDNLGCILTILGCVVALVPLGGFLYEDYTFTPTLWQVTGYSVVAFFLIAFVMLLPGFLARHVRVYLCTDGLIYIYKKISKRRVASWEQITQVESPSFKAARRHPLIRIALDLLVGPGDGWMGRGAGSTFDYCIIHLQDGSKISFSQAIPNLSGLAKDIRGHLKKSRA